MWGWGSENARVRVKIRVKLRTGVQIWVWVSVVVRVGTSVFRLVNRRDQTGTMWESLKHPISPSSVLRPFLRRLVALIDLNVNHEDVLSLRRLRHPTELALDFFENIAHVQNHRRPRALKSLPDNQAFCSSTVLCRSFVHLSTIWPRNADKIFWMRSLFSIYRTIRLYDSSSSDLSASLTSPG